jgi:sulfatase modifying factor 1
MRFPFLLLATALSLAASCAFADVRYVDVPGGSFRSAIQLTDKAEDVTVVAPFRMRDRLVTNAEFLAFVRSEPRWRRDQIAAVFATRGYLSRWAGPSSLGPDARPDEPVTKVSWFAARAYCESEHARLPTWIEWEYAAAADAQRRDARGDAAWQARLLADLTASFSAPSATAANSGPNAYGLYGTHALVGEWVEDYAALFVDADARSSGETGLLRLCGGAALAFVDRTEYALIMRVAALAALAPADSSRSVGFRCVKDEGGDNDIEDGS